MHDEVHGVNDNVELNDTEEAERDDVAPSATLGSISERQNELEQEEGQVQVFDDRVDDWSCGVTEWPGELSVGVGRFATDQIDDDDGC